MNKRTEHTLVAIALVATGITGGVLGHLAHQTTYVEVEQAGATIPHCIHDDYNDGSQELCWTVTVEGTVLIINSNDDVVSGAEPGTQPVSVTRTGAAIQHQSSTSR